MKDKRPGHVLAAVTLSVGALVGSPLVVPGSMPQGVAGARKILFIGNSLTTANDLPARVQALASAVGDHLECRAVAFPDFSLEDHWSQGDATRAIREGGWSIVILQQGPSSLPASRLVLVDYTRRFAAEARRIGARTALYMVWPSRARLGDFDGVSASYAAAAHDIGGMLLPVGEAWRAAWRRDATVGLYGPDGFHPTLLATQLGDVGDLPGDYWAAADRLRRDLGTPFPTVAPLGVVAGSRLTARAGGCGSKRAVRVSLANRLSAATIGTWTTSTE